MLSKAQMHHFIVHCILAIIGGALYYGIEMLWRGQSHWTMAVLGGICFVMIGIANEIFPPHTPVLLQMLWGAVMVTALEFMAGLILNLWFGMDIWDYSNMPFHLWGQVCLPYTFLWFLLSLPAILLEDYLHHWLFGDAKPKYNWI